MNHDAFVDMLSYWLAKASIPHKGGWRGRPRPCKDIFTHIAHQINLVTDHEEANDSDQMNGSADQTKQVNHKSIPESTVAN